ncbi:MAG: hypothetical protein U5J95_02095 [Balneolaceae bacterium]|nr:hypothetical protein [Balneolaceae bacterium]
MALRDFRKRSKTHIALASDLKDEIEQDDNFELLAPVPLNTICFRYKPSNISDLKTLNQLNSRLLDAVNKTGDLFITHTKLNNIYTLRMVIGNTNVTKTHVKKAWNLIQEESLKLI